MNIRAKTVRIKNHTYNVWTILSMLLVFIVGLVMITEAVMNFAMLVTWESGGVLEYEGNYQFSTERRYRNNSYVFSLENGDTIKLPIEYMDSNSYKFDNSEPLKFRYLAFRSVIRFGAYKGVAITTVDDSSTFLQEGYMKREIIFSAVIGLLGGLTVAILCTMPFWFEIWLKVLDSRRSSLRKMRKAKPRNKN